MLRNLIAAILITTATASISWAEPKKFDTPEEVADFTQDFTVEEGTFRVISRKPLHIEIKVAAETEQKYAAESMLRAFLWGVYRTFLHTNADSVKVTVISPVAVDGKNTFTESATRAHASMVAKKLLGASDISELLTKSQSWSDVMKRCYHNDFGAPGVRVCALAVAGYSQ